MEKKYELVMDDTIEINGHTLYRIRALRDFDKIEIGDLGGYIEKESNLSHEGDCWVCDDAKVYGDAKVYDNAKIDESEIYGRAHVYGDATIYDSKIFDDVRVYGESNVEDSQVYGDVHIYGEASVEDSQVYGDVHIYDKVRLCGSNIKVSGCSEIRGNANINDNVQISDFVVIKDYANISSNAIISGDVVIGGFTRLGMNANINTVDTVNYITIGPIGKGKTYTTFYKGSDGLIYADGELFNGPIDDFKKRVLFRYKAEYDSFYRKQYLNAIDFAKANLE